MKTKLKKTFNAKNIESKIKFELRNKYYNIWRNKFEVLGIDDHWSADYLFNQLYKNGTVAAINMQGVGVIPVSYTTSRFGLHYRPVAASVVDNFGITTMPKGNLIVDKEIVIGYVQPSHKGLAQTVDYYTDRMAQVLMALYVNLEVSKVPFIIGTAGDDVDLINDLIDRIYSNELAIFMPSDMVNQLKSLNTGATYLGNDLWTQYLNFESDLLAALGIDTSNVNFARATVDQVNSNNTLIDNINDGLNAELGYFTQKVNEVFGANWSIKVKTPKIESVHNGPQEVEEDA